MRNFRFPSFPLKLCHSPFAILFSNFFPLPDTLLYIRAAPVFFSETPSLYIEIPALMKGLLFSLIR